MAAAGGLLAAAGLAGMGPVGADASSHREAPLIAGAPQYDNTDVYAFRSPDRRRTVTLTANWIPLEEPAGGPTFYAFATDARYNIRIDNDGDAWADITYQWTFRNHYRSGNTFLYNTGKVTSLRDPDLNFYQTYTLKEITRKNGRRNAPTKTHTLIRNRIVAPSDVGQGSMPNYQKLRDQATTYVGKPNRSAQSFAGQAEDPFFLDLRVFDLLYGGDLTEVGDDTLAGFNVNTVALQVNRKALANHGNLVKNPVVGIWSSTDRRGANGRYHQVSRLGMPLFNEVIVPLKDKNRFNASRPGRDRQFRRYVTRPEVPKLIEGLYKIPAPKPPRRDLVSVFLTGVDGLNKPAGVRPSEQLRLNLRTPVSDNPNRLGVIGGDNQGFPNGRRLADDIVDIELQVLEGALRGRPTGLSDGVDNNDVAFGDTFPYVALPESGSNADPHPTAGGLAPSASGGSNGFTLPVLPSSALGLGLLAMLAGVVALVRRPRQVPA